MGPSAVGPVSALQIAAVSSLGQLLPSPPFSYMTQNGLCIDVSILVGRGGELGPGRSVRRQRAETRRLPERPLVGRKTGQRPRITPLMAGFDPFFAPVAAPVSSTTLSGTACHRVSFSTSLSWSWYRLEQALQRCFGHSAPQCRPSLDAVGVFHRLKFDPAVAMPRERAETRDNGPKSDR